MERLETWMPVVGWERYYQISDLGRVKSNEREIRRRHTGPFIKKERVLKTQTHRQGYAVVSLQAEGRSATVKIHRLVAEAFIPNPLSLPLVLHGRNGISDNSTLNLRWGTASENNVDTVRDGAHWQSKKKRCPQDHPYSGKNSAGSRICRVCSREASKRFQERTRNG